jgi:hypothetical protein
LTVVLGLDSTNFKKGETDTAASLKRMREGADTERKAWETNNKRVAESFRGVKNEVVGLAVAVLGTASIIDFSKNAMTTAANVGYLAKQLNLSTEQVSTFEAAVRQMGGTTANADGTITSLAMAMEQFKITGRSPLVGWFQKLGITDSSLLEPKNMQRLLDTLHERFKGMDPTEALFIGTQMGIDPNTMRLLMLSDDAYKKQMETAQKSAAITAEQTAKMQELQQQLGPLVSAYQRLGLELLVDVEPALIAVANAFTGFAEQHPDEAMAALAGLTALLARNTLSAAAAFLGLGKAVLTADGALAAGPLTLAAIGVATSSFAPLPEDYAANSTSYTIARADPKKATTQQLHEALAYIRWIVGQTPKTGQFTGDFQRLAATARAIQAELASRGNVGAVPAVAPLTGFGTTVGAETAAGPTNSVAGGLSVAERNNNPLNLIDPSTKQFLRFASADEGEAKDKAQLIRDYRKHGLHTIFDLIDDRRWGWSNEWALGNSHAATMNYINFVSRAVGVGAHQQIDYTQPDVLNRLFQAMAQFESGRRAPPATITVTVNESKTPAATARAVAAAIAAQANRGLS